MAHYQGPALEQLRSGQFRFEVRLNGVREKVTFDAASLSEAQTKAPGLRAERIAAAGVISSSGSATLTIHQAVDTYLAERYGDYADDPRHLDTQKMLGRAIKDRFQPDDLMIDLTHVELTGLIKSRKRDTVKRTRGGIAKQVPVSNSTVNRTTEFLRRVFGWFERSPYKMKFPDKPDFKEEGVILHEASKPMRLMDSTDYAALGLVAEDADYMEVVDFALLTGMRQANCVEIEKELTKFHWEGSTLIGATYSPKVKSVGTEEEKDEIAFHLSAQAAAILWRRREDHERFFFTYVAKRARDGREVGKRYPITVTGLLSWWTRAKKRAGLKIRFHDLRHTAATNIIAATGDIYAVKAALGHRKVETSMKYLHVVPEVQRARMNAMASATQWGQRQIAKKVA